MNLTLPSAAAILSTSLVLLADLSAQVAGSTRVSAADQRAITNQARGSNSYRQHRRYIIAELDLKLGDTVVDIGAGNGWWAQRMARPVGPEGVVHAGEITDEKVAKMQQRFTKMPQVKPYRCPLDGPGLPENSCDLAFLAQTYHHLPKDRVEYLRRLKSVIKPAGRLCIIERYLEIGPRKTTHGTLPSDLLGTAQKAGWVLARFELLPKTDYYLTIFLQKDLFKSKRSSRRRRVPEANASRSVIKVRRAPSLISSHRPILSISSLDSLPSPLASYRSMKRR